MKYRGLNTRVRYFVNNLLIRNPLWQIFVLLIISGAIILMGIILVDDLTVDSFWWSFTRLLDQGTFIDDNYNPHIALVGVLVTLGGILVLSLLIGIISSKITGQLDSLKRGKSQVIERDHYIVCGEGDRLYEVARELLKAGESGSLDGKIVLFSRHSREDMEEVLLQRLGRKRARRVVCRSGDPTDVDSLCLPCFEKCAGFVLIGDDDSEILKTLVAINSIVGGTRPVGVCETRNKTTRRISEMAYPGIRWVPVREIVMRLIVQVCRQPGLSAVYSEVLSFDGNEFYLSECHDVENCTFREISGRIRSGVAVGIQSGGRMYVNPEPDMKLEPGEKLLILTENSNSFSFDDDSDYYCETLETTEDACTEPMKMLVFSGHSRKFDFMLDLLDSYALKGAEIHVAGSVPEAEGIELLSGSVPSNCNVLYTLCDRTDPDEVVNLHPETYDSIMVISGKEKGLSDEDADSECIVTLLILRDIGNRCKSGLKATVVSEIRNPRNRRLASAAGIDDFVVSNEVCSMIMAQLVLEIDLWEVYFEIFDPSGCEIQLRCPSVYTADTFRGLLAEGHQRREVVLGWLTGTGADAMVYLNPDRESRLPADDGTRVVVIAER